MLNEIRNNPLLLTDAYNLSHQRLKVNTDWEVSHIYNRAKGMILYGFSEIVNSVLNTIITIKMIDEAQEYANKMNLNFPRELFERVVNETDGYFPIEVEALPEGTWVPRGTPFAQVKNTVEGFGELVTWLEGIFLHTSFPSGTATEAFHMRRYLEELREDQGYDESFMIRLHSFGFRGHRSLEDAYWSATSWNLFLHGTDDFHSMKHTPNAMMGSISALAHKVTQQFDNEYEGYIHTIDATYEAGEKIVAMVIDTYDAERFIKEYLVPLSSYAKDKGVHLVIRPDSGDTWEQVVQVYRLVEKHGIDNVSAIIGESMSFDNIKRADRYFNLKQVPLNFVSYGVGGGFYNHIDRDWLGFAMKTAYSNGKPRMKFGMDSIKRSIPDEVGLLYDKDGNIMAERKGNFLCNENLYNTVYYHDYYTIRPLVKIDSWDTIHKRAMLSVAQEELQENIVLSKSIQDLVKEFEKVYG